MAFARDNQPLLMSAARTPIGSMGGVFSSVPATELGSIAIGEAVRRAKIEGRCVDEVLMGNVLTAGLGQSPARQAALGAGLPSSVGATTVNKVCGSGLKAVIMSAQAIASGNARVVVGGGMENMSRAPHLVERGQPAQRIGHYLLVDSVIKDGLWDPYNDFHMGKAGELCATRVGLTREELDDFALESYRRAREAIASGAFRPEIVPVDVTQGSGQKRVDEDEDPNRVDLAGIRTLKPAFQQDGVLTAGNSPSCNDGAAAVVVMSHSESQARELEPMARILGFAGVAVEPKWFSIAPAQAIRKALKSADLSIRDIDLFEINESFSSVSLANSRELGLEDARVNIHGGAVALGHPIGATGTRILTTLLYALQARDARLGIASLCIGGGEALAIIVERAM